MQQKIDESVQSRGRSQPRSSPPTPLSSLLVETSPESSNSLCGTWNLLWWGKSSTDQDWGRSNPRKADKTLLDSYDTWWSGYLQRQGQNLLRMIRGWTRQSWGRPGSVNNQVVSQQGLLIALGFEDSLVFQSRITFCDSNQHEKGCTVTVAWSCDALSSDLPFSKTEDLGLT